MKMENLNRGLTLIFLQILSITAIMYIIIAYYPRHGVVRYDCSISEISPDFPEDIKQECRKLKARKIT